jgi:hypothetical protein
MRARSALAVVGLALAAAGAWLVLRDGRSASPAEPPDVRPPAGTTVGIADLEPPGTPLAADLLGSERGLVALGGDGAGAQAEVEIRDAAGAPLAGAMWVVFSGDEVFGTGTTGEGGLARFQLGAGAGELAVLPQSSGFQRFALDLAARRQAVALAAGAAVAGRVEIDGREPEEPVALMLRGDAYPPSELPAPVFEVLPRDLRAHGYLQTATGKGGAFRFDGLAPDWSGRLSWRGELFPLRDEHPEDLLSGHGLEIHGPAEDLRIELTTAARVVGRVVDPVSGAGIQATMWVSCSAHGTYRTESAPDGTFSCSYGRVMPSHVDLRVSTLEQAGARTVAFDIPPGVRIYDVGSIAVRATRTVACVVRDVDGRAIAGAEVRAIPEDQLGARSDPDGLVRLAVPSASQGLRVAAQGFEAAEVPLPTGDDVAAVVLLRDTVLEVRIPPDRPGLGVLLSSSEPPFLQRGEPAWTPEVARMMVSDAHDGEHHRTTFSGRKEGIYSLAGVRPGVALTLSLVDRAGTSVVDLAVGPLQGGDHRVLEPTVAAAPRTLVGRVHDADGVPVRGAAVYLDAFGSRPVLGGETDADGGFRIEDLYAPSVDLAVHAEGYHRLELAELPVAEAPLDLVLEAVSR